jgi:D-serine deaminase-like pyridoxal phosphate-dependent protein
VQITHPTLRLEEAAARRNIERMVGKARASGVRFRPHFKTHQSAEVGRWFRDCGVEAITVSSLAMARYFAADGWHDITLAVPVNLCQLDEIDRLAGEVRLGLLIDNRESLHALTQRLGNPADLWIEIDPGYGRTGVPWDRTEIVVELARIAGKASNLRLQGLLTHSGHTYTADSEEQIRQIFDQTAVRMGSLRDALQREGLDCRISVGDTPGCSVVERFTGVDEVRPGCFVLYDLMQHRLGCCETTDIALTVACPVIGIYPERSRVAIYGGTVHLGREPLPHGGGTIYGLALPEGRIPAEDFQGAARLTGLTQEHGVIEADQEMIRGLAPGDLLTIYPVHACITAALHNSYLDKDGRRIDRLAAGHDGVMPG